MDGLPLLDYTPPTLLGVCFLSVIFGLLVPWRTVKQYIEQRDSWKSAFENEQAAHAETLRQRAEDQKTISVVRRLFEEMEQGVGS